MLPATLAATRRRAARLERLERSWPFVLPALAALVAFAVLAELALPQRLPVWTQVVVVLALAGFVCSRVWNALRHAPPVPTTVLDRRIESRSALRHQPLQTLADRPAGEAEAIRETVWQAHRARTAQQLDRLRTGAPRLGLWRHPAGRLALALLALLALSWVLAGGAARDRLASGFLPGLFELPGPAPWMQAWITPPDYARAAPTFLTGSEAQVTVPSGSVLQVSLTGLHGKPRLRTHALGAVHSDDVDAARFERLSEGSWRLSSTLDAGATLSLSGNGRRLAHWVIQVTPLPPSLLAWDGTPGASAEPWRTRLPWRISNPYGVDRLAAEIRLATPAASAAFVMKPLRVPIPLEPDTRAAHGAALPDLAADPRAGEAVVANLTATDKAGHVTRSTDARFILPARRFRSPLARAVLDTRNRLALGRESRAAASDDLEALGGAPGQFAADSGLFLNLASVVALLRQDDDSDADAIAGATVRLWELALALEDGLHNDRAGARASADVRGAREAVSAQLEHMRALGDKSQSVREQSELERRIQALSQAIARRMRALAEQAMLQHTMLPPMPDQRMLSGSDLSRMMQQMRDQAQHGDTQGAMRRLAQMQSMLDRMRAATPRDVQAAQRQAEAAQQAREQTQGLRDLVKHQAALLDRTQARLAAREQSELAQGQSQAQTNIDPQTAELLRRLGIPPDTVAAAPGAGDQTPPDYAAGSPGRGADAGPTDPARTAAQMAARKSAAQARAVQRGQDAHVQHALARALDELGQEFQELSGKRPPGLDEAHRDMDRARTSLASGQDAPAGTAEQQALAALQRGSSQMRQMMASGAAGSAMLMPGLADGSGGSARDDDAGDDPGDDPGQDQADGEQRSGPRDPLGRPVASGPESDDGDTHVPDKFQKMRAREIEQELRRRDSDRTRPPAELNYLDRLLRSF